MRRGAAARLGTRPDRRESLSGRACATASQVVRWVRLWVGRWSAGLGGRAVPGGPIGAPPGDPKMTRTCHSPVRTSVRYWPGGGEHTSIRARRVPEAGRGVPVVALVGGGARRARRGDSRDRAGASASGGRGRTPRVFRAGGAPVHDVLGGGAIWNHVLAPP